MKLRPLLLLPCLSPTLPLPAAAAPESYPCQNGLVRSLVAREPMFMNPVAVAVDTDGAIYVTETTRRKVADLDIREVMDWVPDDLSHLMVEHKRKFYHQAITTEKFKNHPSLKDHNGDGTIDWRDLTVHSEKIHKLVDTDGDGVADKAAVFAEGFNTEVTGIAAGVLARHGDVYATIAPDVWWLRDKDGDGKADERKAIATGFGVHINYAGHDMHGLIMGPDGKVYWTIGDKGLHVVTRNQTCYHYPHEGALLRCNPDGTDFEVFAHGLRNVQQIAFDDYGNIFGVDNDSDQKGEKERLLYIVEGSDSGWRCYYQYRGGKYNPWMDERIAFPDGPDRPASIPPPLSLYLDGPSGLAHNPGTALNERYRDHFFLTQFPAGKINAFKMVPDGAAYKMTDDHLMASGTAFVGCNFGPDGALFVADWQGGYPLKEKGALWKIDDPKESGSAVRQEVARMLKESTEKVPDAELLKRLGHADQRVRLDAQWELVARGKREDLKKVAASSAAPQLARIHALWGLSQGYCFDQGLFDSLAADADPEIRAQAAKWSACSPKRVISESFVRLLSDPSPRVRFQAAMATSVSASPEILKGVLAMLEENNNRDRFLFHAGSRALEGSSPDDFKALARHPSVPVRLAALVAFGRILDDDLRRELAVLIDPELQPFCITEGEIMAKGELEKDYSDLKRSFLDDDSPAVVAEAAWIFYEFEPALVAKLLDRKIELPPPAIRRAIASNRRIGDATSLRRLAKFAVDSSRPSGLRLVALEALASVRSSEPLDEVDGHYAPLQVVQVPADLASELAATISQLSNDENLSKSLSAAIDALGAKQDLGTLAKQAADPKLDTRTRIGALQHLKNGKASTWTAIAEKMLEQDSPTLRPAAAGLLAGERPGVVLEYIRKTGLRSTDLAERQSAVRMLPALSESKSLLDGLVADLSAGNLDPGIRLEVIESASSLQLDSIHEAEAALNAKGGLAKWSYALAGGDAAAGKKVFEENLSANCMACHRIGEEGSNVGPPLSAVGKKGREYLLQSLVDPQASIAPGYGMMTLTKKDGSSLAGALVEEKDRTLILQQPDGSKASVPVADIATKTPPVSAMPPMGEILKPRELRDLLEYLSSLK